MKSLVNESLDQFLNESFKEGDRVILPGDEDEGWEEEHGIIIEKERPLDMYIVQLDDEYVYDEDDDGIREVEGVNMIKEDLNETKKKKWIQSAFKSIKKKGTVGKCTGEKFGSSSCPEGSKQYVMAANLRKIAKKKKKK